MGLRMTSWDIPGVEPPPGQEHITIRYNVVSASYFDVMGIPVVSGRPFTNEDRVESEPVAIISEITARRYWPDETPLGRTIQRAGTEESYRIVGVAQDTKVWWMGETWLSTVWGDRGGLRGARRRPWPYLCKEIGKELGMSAVFQRPHPPQPGGYPHSSSTADC